MLKTTTILIMFLVSVMGLLWLINQKPYHELPAPPDDVEEAIKLIKAGEIVIPHEIFFPIYMSRFELEVVDIKNCYSSLLPIFRLSDRAVKITDSKTGYAWITNGFSPYLRVK